MNIDFLGHGDWTQNFKPKPGSVSIIFRCSEGVGRFLLFPSVIDTKDGRVEDGILEGELKNKSRWLVIAIFRDEVIDIFGCKFRSRRSWKVCVLLCSL